MSETSTIIGLGIKPANPGHISQLAYRGNQVIWGEPITSLVMELAKMPQVSVVRLQTVSST